MCIHVFTSGVTVCAAERSRTLLTSSLEPLLAFLLPLLPRLVDELRSKLQRFRISAAYNLLIRSLVM